MVEFNINEKFEFISQLTTMVCHKHHNSLLILGDGGLGKTYTAVKAIEESGVHYKKVSGYSTARGLYNLLYDYNGSLMLFDDCDSILEDKTSQNILKIALDSNVNRTISWAAKMPKDSEYPNEFEFTGRIIFISNKPKEKIFQPLLTRGPKVDLTMTPMEKIQRMEAILEPLCRNNGFNYKDGLIALEFIKDKMDICNELSLRTLLDVIRIVNSKLNKWERLAEYTISQ